MGMDTGTAPWGRWWAKIAGSGRTKPVSCIEAWMRDVIRDGVLDGSAGHAGRVEPWLRRGGMLTQGDGMEGEQVEGLGVGLIARLAEAGFGPGGGPLEDGTASPPFNVVPLDGVIDLGTEARAAAADPRGRLQAIGLFMEAVDDSEVANSVLDALAAVVGARAAMAAVPRVVRVLCPILRAHRTAALKACVEAVEQMGMRQSATDAALSGLQQQLADVHNAAAIREAALLAELSMLRALLAGRPVPSERGLVVGVAGLVARVPAVLGDPIPKAARSILMDLVELQESRVVIDGPWGGGVAAEEPDGLTLPKRAISPGEAEPCLT